jgi:hypothetical protein
MIYEKEPFIRLIVSKEAALCFGKFLRDYNFISIEEFLLNFQRETIDVSIHKKGTG